MKFSCHLLGLWHMTIICNFLQTFGYLLSEYLSFRSINQCMSSGKSKKVFSNPQGYRMLLSLEIWEIWEIWAGKHIRYRICVLLILVIYMTHCDLHLHLIFTSFRWYVIHFVLCLRLCTSLAVSNCLWNLIKITSLFLEWILTKIYIKAI